MGKGARAPKQQKACGGEQTPFEEGLNAGMSPEEQAEVVAGAGRASKAAAAPVSKTRKAQSAQAAPKKRKTPEKKMPLAATSPGVVNLCDATSSSESQDDGDELSDLGSNDEGADAGETPVVVCVRVNGVLGFRALGADDDDPYVLKADKALGKSLGKVVLKVKDFATVVDDGDPADPGAWCDPLQDLAHAARTIKTLKEAAIKYTKGTACRIGDGLSKVRIFTNAVSPYRGDMHEVQDHYFFADMIIRSADHLKHIPGIEEGQFACIIGVMVATDPDASLAPVPNALLPKKKFKGLCFHDALEPLVSKRSLS